MGSLTRPPGNGSIFHRPQFGIPSPSGQILSIEEALKAGSHLFAMVVRPSGEEKYKRSDYGEG